MNSIQSIRATLLGLAEFVVITVATLGIPFASGSLNERTVRLFRGMNQRAVFEAASSDVLSLDGSSGASIFEPGPGDAIAFSGDATDVAASSPFHVSAFHRNAAGTVPFPITLDAPRAATGAPLRARAPPVG